MIFDIQTFQRVPARISLTPHESCNPNRSHTELRMRSDFSQKRIWITGHNGMLGSALVRSLRSNGANLFLTSRNELDLTDRDSLLSWMRQNQPQWIFHVAAKVGGIQANAMFPADFLSQNLQIQTNVIDGAHQIGAEKLVFV